MEGGRLVAAAAIAVDVVVVVVLVEGARKRGREKRLAYSTQVFE